MPTLTWWVRVVEFRLGRNLPHAAGGSHLRIVGQGDLDQRIARAAAHHLLGHIEDGIAAALMRELHDHLAGPDHLARLRADRGHCARRIGDQDRVAQLILRDAQLRLSVIDLRLGCPEVLLRFVESGARRPAILQQLLLPPEGEARLDQHRLRRGKGGFCRAQ